MPYPLKKPIVRAVDVSLNATGFRSGLVARITPEGIYVKPPGSRWTSAYFTSWADIMLVGADRKAAEVKKARAERRKLKKLGVS